MYRALYRKWRPQTFADVVGQEAITTALANQIPAGKIGHAYLFTGTRGTGKTSCAKIFAMAANCESPNGAEPCGACVMCKGLADGSILDVAEIDAASNNGVDDVRDLRDETAFRPSRGRYRVYIIDEVHMLTTQAFNALLKTLEEPPGHVIFILATTEIHKVPATILSRCQRFDFLRISAEKIADRLQYIASEEGIALTDGAADLIARLGDGSMRDALSLLDTCAGGGAAVDEALVRQMAGVADKRYLFDISAAAQQGDVPALLALINQLRGQSIDVRRLGEELVFHYRNLLLAKAASDGSLLESVPGEERQQYTSTAATLPEGLIIRSMQRLAQALDKMGRSPDPRIELELALFDLAEYPAAQAPADKQPATATPVPPPAAPVAVPVSAPAPLADDAPPFDVDDAPVPAPMPANAPPLEMAAEQTAPPEKTPPAGPDAPAALAPVPSSAPGTVPEATAEPGALAEFAAWPQVLEQMAGVDRMLSSYMNGTTAYTDGVRVLIDGGAVFLEYVRQNAAAREKIKTVIEQVSGKRYGIGPYDGTPKAAKQPQKTAEDTLQEWEAMGVTIIRE